MVNQAPSLVSATSLMSGPVPGSANWYVAAVDPVTGRPLPWRVALNLREFDAVRHLVIARSTLYLAGDFESVNGVPQKGLAAVGLR